MYTRLEAQNLVRQLTIDERGKLLMAPLPPSLSSDASKAYREIHQVLSDANTNVESQEQASIFREELQQPYLDDDVFYLIGEQLKPSEAALRALGKQIALKNIREEERLSEPEKKLALEAKAALENQSHFAHCSRFFHQTMQFTLKRLIEILFYHLKRGNLVLVEKILKSYDENKLFLLLTQTHTHEAYPGKSLTLMQLAYVEKNARMCQMLKKAFKRLPNGIEIMQEQLDEPFTKSRNQAEIPYHFDALITAITTDTNVEVELAKYREELARITEERGFPLTIFIQIHTIFMASAVARWTDAQYDTWFIKVMGGAIQMSPDWLKLAFALGIDAKNCARFFDQPFVLQSLDSIDPMLDDDDLLTGLGKSYSVNLFGHKIIGGKGGWDLALAGFMDLITPLKTLLDETRQSMVELRNQSDRCTSTH